MWLGAMKALMQICARSKITWRFIPMIRSLSNTFDKSLNVTTGKDIVSTTGDVVKAKESLSRIEKNLFYRLGMYLRSKLGTQLVNCSHISPIQRSNFLANLLLATSAKQTL